jgi:hypothetical protein
MSAGRTRHWRALVAATAIVVACAICAGDATAQKNQGPPNALQGFSQNRDEPVKIRAAALELREKDKMATFTSGVSKMDQGRVEGLFQSGPRNAPDPRNPVEKNNTADKNNTAEKSSSAEKR